MFVLLPQYSTNTILLLDLVVAVLYIYLVSRLMLLSDCHVLATKVGGLVICLDLGFT